ncbi:MAG: hypothetical protein C0509_06150 [Acinetobacter sp.]|nr:hypothetical protein [Acinetobacter sp.]
MSRVANQQTPPYNSELVDKMINAVLENKACQEMAHLKRVTSIQDDTIKTMQNIIDRADARNQALEKMVADQAKEIVTLTNIKTGPALAATDKESAQVDFDPAEIADLDNVSGWELRETNARLTRAVIRSNLCLLLTFSNLATLGFVLYNLS